MMLTFLEGVLRMHNSKKKINLLFSYLTKDYRKPFVLSAIVVLAITSMVVLPQALISQASTNKQFKDTPNLLPQTNIDDGLNALVLQSCSDTNFSAPPVFDLGNTPQSLAIGDLDGDGKADLVAINLLGNNVSVLRNTGTTTTSFAPHVDFTVGSLPNTVALGDIDGDGKLDIVVTNNTSSTISVLRNTSSIGALSFTRTDFSAGNQPQPLAIGDIDGDGKLDVVVGNYSNKTISILRNTSNVGSVSFATFFTSFFVPNNPRSIVIGDIDGDGKTDVAVANSGSSNVVSVFRNTSSVGSMVLNAPINYATGTSPSSVIIGDLDGDGKQDLAVANSGSNDVSMFLNSSIVGSISFTTTPNLAVGSLPSSIKAGQIDSDGKLDLVVVNRGNNNVSVLRNTSSIGLLSFATHTDFAVGNGPNCVVVADLDGDGRAELAITNASARNLIVLNNRTSSSTISFLGVNNISLGTSLAAIAITDLDGDTKPDVVIVDDSINSVSVLMNTSTIGTASFTRTDFTVGTLPDAVAIGDLDGDGKPDLAVANYTSNTISVLLNTSTLGSISFSSAISLNIGTTPSAVAIGDIDGDGKLDLAVTGQNTNTVRVLLNNSTIGSVNFSPATTFAVGTVPMSVAIGDIDGDGKPDLAIANQNSNNVSVLKNNSSIGSATFASATNFAVSIVPRSILMADLDGDGKLDLATANRASTGTTVSVLRNTSSVGTINFATRNDFTVETQPYGIVAGDVDGDGKLDLVVSNGGNNSVSVLKNNSSTGSMNFNSRTNYLVGTNPFGVGIADLDGNNKLDIVTINYSSNNMSILLNTCTSIP